MELLPEPLPVDPMPLLAAWLDEAAAKTDRPNPNAMSLATVDASGQPDVRVVLAKELNTELGYIVFYTNYQSPKGAEIEANSAGAISMHWDSLGRQVRAQGILLKSPDEESDAYFASRDRGSQIGAWASDQSQPVASRAALKQRFNEAEQRFGDEPVPRPSHWGGYRLWLQSVELWISRESRLHDRGRWERQLALVANDAAIEAAAWKNPQRLQP